ncbi:MAG: GNAT family N-acetyltransferase [Alphaproteobacteria bacterium]
MALLRSLAAATSSPTLRGEQVLLRPAIMSDYSQWSHLREESRSFLESWEPIWPADDLTRLSFRRRIRRYQQDVRNGIGYPFFIFSADGHTLLGGVTLGQIQRGVSQSAVLGYWMGERYANKGFMTASVRAVVSFAFDTLRLNRVEAACLLNNEASMRLLQKVGFEREGFARKYLCIDGRWQDHVLFGYVRDDQRG